MFLLRDKFPADFTALLKMAMQEPDIDGFTAPVPAAIRPMMAEVATPRAPDKPASKMQALPPDLEQFTEQLPT